MGGSAEWEWRIFFPLDPHGDTDAHTNSRADMNSSNTSTSDTDKDADPSAPSTSSVADPCPSFSLFNDADCRAAGLDGCLSPIQSHAHNGHSSSSSSSSSQLGAAMTAYEPDKRVDIYLVDQTWPEMANFGLKLRGSSKTPPTPPSPPDSPAPAYSSNEPLATYNVELKVRREPYVSTKGSSTLASLARSIKAPFSSSSSSSSSNPDSDVDIGRCECWKKLIKNISVCTTYPGLVGSLIPLVEQSMNRTEEEIKAIDVALSTASKDCTSTLTEKKKKKKQLLAALTSLTAFLHTKYDSLEPHPFELIAVSKVRRKVRIPLVESPSSSSSSSSTSSSSSPPGSTNASTTASSTSSSPSSTSSSSTTSSNPGPPLSVAAEQTDIEVTRVSKHIATQCRLPDVYRYRTICVEGVKQQVTHARIKQIFKNIINRFGNARKIQQTNKATSSSTLHKQERSSSMDATSVSKTAASTTTPASATAASPIPPPPSSSPPLPPCSPIVPCMAAPPGAFVGAYPEFLLHWLGRCCQKQSEMNHGSGSAINTSTKSNKR